MEDILSDSSKFSLSSNDDNLQNLTKFQRFLYRLRKKKNSLSEEDYHRMVELRFVYARLLIAKLFCADDS